MAVHQARTPVLPGVFGPHVQNIEVHADQHKKPGGGHVMIIRHILKLPMRLLPERMRSMFRACGQTVLQI